MQSTSHNCPESASDYQNKDLEMKEKEDKIKAYSYSSTKEKVLIENEEHLYIQCSSIRQKIKRKSYRRLHINPYPSELCQSRSKNDGELTWKISQFSKAMENAREGAEELLISDPFYSHENGYKLCTCLWINGSGRAKGRYISIGLQIIVGDYDDSLIWPVSPRFIFTLLDQREDPKQRRNITASFDAKSIARPTYERQMGKGARKFVLQSVAGNNNYCKNDTIFIRCAVVITSKLQTIVDV
ncbi:TNF receptor-associated factor 3-like [Xenia sp. Carnegie-2017]|uniref:TNF receptor-associated factor 3-like n=1 Tax=Xenia sp. Carnegie-2017 TaxID=2897299 RepID=UPI001F03D35D|nr:TNF receptor-associated factor 3-like [Xenia sp. Carnegie-2017]